MEGSEPSCSAMVSAIQENQRTPTLKPQVNLIPFGRSFHAQMKAIFHGNCVAESFEDDVMAGS